MGFLLYYYWPFLKLIKRNKEYINNPEEVEILKVVIKDLFDFWLITESNQTNKVNKIGKNKMIVDKNYEEFDKLIGFESYNPNLDEIKRLRFINSKEHIHEINQRLIKYYRKDGDNLFEFNKLINLILKIFTIQQFINISNNETKDE